MVEFIMLHEASDDSPIVLNIKNILNVRKTRMGNRVDLTTEYSSEIGIMVKEEVEDIYNMLKIKNRYQE